MHSRVHVIKRAQKEKLLFRTISSLFFATSIDDSRLQGVELTRVQLSPDKGSCTVFFYIPEGADAFQEKLKTLILYKPSLRSAVAKTIESRYTPDLVFKFDTQHEKAEKVEQLLHQISIDLKKEDS